MKTYTEERWAYLDVGEGVRYGHYEISDRGRVRHVMKHNTRYLRTFQKKPRSNGHGSDVMMVKAHGKEIAIHRKVYETFVGEIPKGMYVYHKNGMITDNFYNNLGLIDKHNLGKRFGKMSKKKGRILRVDRNGEIVEIYKNCREAGKATHFCYQSILNRCNGKVKKEWLPDGTTFRWEEKE